MEVILVFFRCEIGDVSGTTLMFGLNETGRFVPLLRFHEFECSKDLYDHWTAAALSFMIGIGPSVN
jgi:hypothetical protein